MQKDGHNKNVPSEKLSEEEQNFLKRYSLKKVTIPKEKLRENITFTVWQENEDLRKWFNPDYISPKNTTRKKERIEYCDLSKVMQTNKPWWLESRGVIRNLSGQRFVSLVEETEEDENYQKNVRLEAGVDKKFKKNESKSSIDVAQILSREMHLCIKQAGETQSDKQTKPILKSPTVTPINSEFGFQNHINSQKTLKANNNFNKKSEQLEIQELDENNNEEHIENKTLVTANSEEMAWIQERLDRVQILLMSLDDLRLHSGCEKCKGKGNVQQNHNGKYAPYEHVAANARNSPARPSQFKENTADNTTSTLHNEPKVCTCDLEIIDQEMIDLCCFLQELADRQTSTDDQCQYMQIMCRLRDIRKYLCDFMKKVVCCSEDTLARKSETLEKVQNLFEPQAEEPPPQPQPPRKSKCCKRSTCLSGGGSSDAGCCTCCSFKKAKKKSDTAATNIPEEFLPPSWRHDEETQTEECTNMVFIQCFYYNPLTGECQFQDPNCPEPCTCKQPKDDANRETQLQHIVEEDPDSEFYIQPVPTRSKKPQTTEPVCCICQMPKNAHCCCCPLKDKTGATDSNQNGKRDSELMESKLKESKKGKDKDKENSKASKKSKSSKSEGDYSQEELSKSKSNDRKKQKEKIVLPQPDSARSSLVDECLRNAFCAPESPNKNRQMSDSRNQDIKQNRPSADVKMFQSQDPHSSQDRFGEDEEYRYGEEERDPNRPLAEIVVESIHSMKEQQIRHKQQQQQPDYLQQEQYNHQQQPIYSQQEHHYHQQRQEQYNNQKHQQPNYAQQTQPNQQQQPNYAAQEHTYANDRANRPSKIPKPEVTFRQDYPQEEPYKEPAIQDSLQYSYMEPVSDVSEELVKNLSKKPGDENREISIDDPFEGPAKDPCKEQVQEVKCMSTITEKCTETPSKDASNNVKRKVSFHNIQKTPRSTYTRSSTCACQTPAETAKTIHGQQFNNSESDSSCELQEIKICANRSLGGDLSAHKFCQCCYGKGVPIVEQNLAEIIRSCIKNQKRGDVFLKFTIAPNNLFHIQIATIDNVFLGCFYATETATIEARNSNGFDGCITLSVTEPQNSPSQIERLVDHAFMVVQQERRSKS